MTDQALHSMTELRRRAVLRRIVLRSFADQLGLIAAGIAFYALMAIFPAIAALIALAGLFTDPDVVVTQLEGVAALLPAEASGILLRQAHNVAAAPDPGLSLTLWIGVGFAIYLSTRATTSLVHGMNLAYGQREQRGYLRYWATVIFLTAGLLFGSVLVLLLLVGLPAVLAFIPIESQPPDLLIASRWLVVVLVFLVGVATLYRFGPSAPDRHWIWISPGVFVAGVMWFAGCAVFSIYVANFARYDEVFGSLGGVVILLTWFWLSAFILLIGALVDAETGARAGALKGARRPIPTPPDPS